MPEPYRWPSVGKVHSNGPYGDECRHRLPDGMDWIHPAHLPCPVMEEPQPTLLSESVVKGNDPVKKPSHYTSHPSGIECWDVTRHMNFNLGNAIKYIWRCDLKDNPIQDLEKAIEYIQDEIAMRKGDRHE